MNYKILLISIIVNGFSPAEVALSEPCRVCPMHSNRAERLAMHTELLNYNPSNDGCLSMIFHYLDSIAPNLETYMKDSNISDKYAYSFKPKTIPQILQDIQGHYKCLNDRLDNIIHIYDHTRYQYHRAFWKQQISKEMQSSNEEDTNDNMDMRANIDMLNIICNNTLNTIFHEIHKRFAMSQYIPELINKITQTVHDTQAYLQTLPVSMQEHEDVKSLSEYLPTVLHKASSVSLLAQDDAFFNPPNAIISQHTILIKNALNDNISTIRERLSHEEHTVMKAMVLFDCITHMLVHLRYLTDAYIVLVIENNIKSESERSNNATYVLFLKFLDIFKYHDTLHQNPRANARLTSHLRLIIK